MSHEKGYTRFFTYLNLFMFMMLLLVLGANYIVMFVGWEGVGLCSYLLIGFYYDKNFAADAGKKAFIVNRIGDFGFILGIFLIFNTFGSADYSTVFAAASANPGAYGGAATAICLLLFVGAAGKSAQIPLYVWLPDVQRNLRGLAGRADEEQQADGRGRAAVRARIRARRGEDRRVVGRSECVEDQEDAEDEAEVADAVDDERLLAGVGGEVLVVVEADEQVGAEPNTLPPHEHDDVVRPQDEQQHHEH